MGFSYLSHFVFIFVGYGENISCQKDIYGCFFKKKKYINQVRYSFHFKYESISNEFDYI